MGIGLCQVCCAEAIVSFKGCVELFATRDDTSFLGNDCVIRTRASQNVLQLHLGLVAKCWAFLQAQYLGTGETGMLSYKRQKLRGYGFDVAGVQVEVAGGDLHVVGIGRLHDQQTARHQHAVGLRH